ncbi:uncharacterized protein LOC119095914 [Pollicipes pollicipes]|uniref:uncharacterized protein LOC119095914 n=1 Tax=Pollicipes pollicipes TaxID=41117 RepID=UPI001884AA3C|nr:uncharacterized protein LOC119095914 [Pollicipes pollicipes]
MPYKALTQLTAEPLTLGKCVVEVSGKNVSEKNDSDVTTTKAPFNFSQGAAMLSTNRLRVASTGSVLGLLLLLALFVYCMCLRTAPSAWESESSWSESPKSWTTSSTSSWTSTPVSSDDLYSSESFDFERDAHLVGDRKTLEYMRGVQEAAARRRRAARPESPVD